jgi:hypothetical protein
MVVTAGSAAGVQLPAERASNHLTGASLQNYDSDCKCCSLHHHGCLINAVLVPEQQTPVVHQPLLKRAMSHTVGSVGRILSWDSQLLTAVAASVC